MSDRTGGDKATGKAFVFDRSFRVAEEDRSHDPADAQRAPTDADIAAALTGDQSAFTIVYLDVQPKLRRYATSLVGDEADDVTAEAWLQIARDLRRFSGDLDAFRGWTARIVRNRAMDLLRSKARRPFDPTPADELPPMPTPDDAETAALDRITTANAVSLISTLPSDQAEAVLLQTVVGLNGRDAAAVLGKTPGAVRVARHRGLKTLAKRLRQHDGRWQ